MVIARTQKELSMPQVKKCGHHHTEADLGERAAVHLLKAVTLMSLLLNAKRCF